jgi:DNA polymerase
LTSFRERALLEMGLAPGWVRRHVVASPAGALPDTPSQDAAPVRELSVIRVQQYGLAALAAAIEQCQACPRASARTRAVAGQGPSQVRLMVVDQVPSRHDASAGALRDSDGARLFEQLLFSIGLKREAVYLSHALRCDGSVPTGNETTSCAPYLQREIELLAPRALLALGSAAAEAIRAHAAPDAPRVFALSHPAELLSNAALKRAAWATLRELTAYLRQG